MASLTRQDGVYGLVWTDNSRKQRQTRESLKTTSKTEAKRKKAQLENLYYKGEHDPWQRKWYERKRQSVYRLEDAVEQFIRYKSRARGQEGWGDIAERNEPFTMRKFARFTGKDRLLSTLTEKDLENFYYRDSVNSGHTRQSLYISVNTFLNWCVKNEILKDKPVFKPKKPQSKIPKYIEIEDFATLIKNQEWDWIRYGWMILASTGMRPKELANLKLTAIEKDAIIIGEDFTTKVRAERKIPILFEARYAIDKLTGADFNREHQPEYLLDRKPNYTKGKLSRRFTATWDKCFPDNPKRSLYNLKDLFAVRYLSDDSIETPSGMKLNDLKEILGHVSLETTQRYLKAIPHGTKIEGTIFDYL